MKAFFAAVAASGVAAYVVNKLAPVLKKKRKDGPLKNEAFVFIKAGGTARARAHAHDGADCN